MTIAPLPPLTRPQRAALTSVVAAGRAGAAVSNRNAGGLLLGPSGELVAVKAPGFGIRVHWRTAEALVALGYATYDGVAFGATEHELAQLVKATALGRQRERIEQRRFRAARPSSDDLRTGKPQRRHPSNLKLVARVGGAPGR